MGAAMWTRTAMRTRTLCLALVVFCAATVALNDNAAAAAEDLSPVLGEVVSGQSKLQINSRDGGYDADNNGYGEDQQNKDAEGAHGNGNPTKAPAAAAEHSRGSQSPAADAAAIAAALNGTTQLVGTKDKKKQIKT